MGTKEETNMVTDPTGGPEQKTHVQLVNLGKKEVYYFFSADSRQTRQHHESSQKTFKVCLHGEVMGKHT